MVGYFHPPDLTANSGVKQILHLPVAIKPELLIPCTGTMQHKNLTDEYAHEEEGKMEGENSNIKKTKQVAKKDR